MESVSKNKLRNMKSKEQGLAPRKTLCSGCPHTNEVRTMTCDVRDAEMFCLEEPHICHKERDGLCRGVVEKMIMNGMTWGLSGQ